MNRRMLQVLLGALLLTLTSVPAWAICRPENRVGKIFSGPSKSAFAAPDQTLERRGENAGCGYDFASGVHKYLYAQSNPVMGTDPSGHDGDLISLEVSTGIGEELDSLEAVGSTVAKRAFTAPIVDIYACAGLQAYIVPAHAWVYAKQPGPGGLRYDIGVTKIGPGALFGTPGSLSVHYESLQEVKRDANLFFFKVGSLNELQFMGWNGFVLADAELGSLPVNGAMRDLTYSLDASLPVFAREVPEVVNCVTFTALASIEAKLMSLRK